MTSLPPPSLGTLKKATISYGMRQVFVTIVGLIANIILTRLLFPDEYGRFAVIMMVLSLGMIFADGGLGIYLIQRKEDVTEMDVSKITNLQLSVAVTFLALLFLLATFNHYYVKRFPILWLLFCSCLGIPFFVIRGMCLVRLERHLQMSKIAIVDIAEQVVFAAVSIFLAYRGAGVWSIAIGLIMKSVAGCFLAVFLSPFSYKFVFPTVDREFMEGLKFALHYQGAQLITIARIAVNPIFINSTLGLQNGGFVERANYINSAPSGFLSMIQDKVWFPFSSRIQNEREKLKKFFEDSVYLYSALDKVFYLPLLLFTTEIVSLFLTDKWLPMVPLMQWFFAGTMIFGALTAPFYPVMNGLGQSRIIFRLNFLGMILSWALIVPLCLVYGIVGVGIASFILWFGVIINKIVLNKHIGPFVYFMNIIKPTTACAISWVFISTIQHYYFVPPKTLFQLCSWSIISVLSYLFILCILDFNNLKRIFRNIYYA